MMVKYLDKTFAVICIFSVYRGTASGQLWLGPLLVTLIVIFKFFSKSEFKLIFKKAVFVTIIGAIVETLMITLGVYTPILETRLFLPWPIIPLWIIVLWLNFGLIIDYFAMVVRYKYYISGIFAFIFANLKFHNAQNTGILTLNMGLLSNLILGIAWMVVIMIILKYLKRLKISN